jgi:hypothetical protein
LPQPLDGGALSGGGTQPEAEAQDLVVGPAGVLRDLSGVPAKVLRSEAEPGAEGLPERRDVGVADE